ncbi:MAG: prolyl oligopeptidase family serine peptidase [Ktedonobacteraceae bacterium]
MHNINTRRDDTVENYHGTQVADPYRWLEEARSEETRAWVAAQNEVSVAYFQAASERRAILARLTELIDFPRYSAPVYKGGRYFFSHNTGLQNQSVLYTQQNLESLPATLLDPNTLSADGTIALITQAYSHDGALLAYGVSASGSDWQEVKVRRIDSGEDYPDVIRWSKFTSVAWKHDNSGFYYDRFPQPGSVPEADQSCYNRIYWHKLGTSQEEDQLIYERPDAKELGFSASISDDGKYLLLHVWLGTDPKNRFYYREVESSGPFVRLLDDFDAAYSFAHNIGPRFYFHTNLDAPRGRIIAIDIEHPERAHWREVLPEQEDVIASVQVVHQQFVITWKHDAHHLLKRYTLEGQLLGEIALPALGSIAEVTGEPSDSEVFLNFMSFLYPPSILRYDFLTETLSLWRGPHLNFDAEQYETTQVFYSSKDSTRVPMFLTHKKGLVLDGTNPTLLYGYGGFNISLTPTFSSHNLLWLEQGGVFALPNLRGGDEYGEEWHLAGMLEKKQNVFDDFIAAAEWLIANNYTNSSRLAINGGSNGGLLVAACMVQRPDLYGAVLCEVPVIDMLRYHTFTVGRYWVSEYGNAEQDPVHFAFLYAYSPLHNVRSGVAYPATLIMAADSDDRVVPSHAKKFAATLQAATSGPEPILLRIETKAGHGLGKPTAKIIEARGDVFAFLFQQFGMRMK